MIRFLAAFFILAMLLPVTAFATSHAQHGALENSQDKSFDQSAPDSMASAGAMYIVGDVTNNGVRGMAHLKDVREAMAKMNLDATHHFMIAFVDAKTGKQIESGKVALKIKNPDGIISRPVQLSGMQGHFGADIVLAQPGEYEFIVGSELSDGLKRNFNFHYEMQ